MKALYRGQIYEVTMPYCYAVELTAADGTVLLVWRSDEELLTEAQIRNNTPRARRFMRGEAAPTVAKPTAELFTYNRRDRLVKL